MPGLPELDDDPQSRKESMQIVNQKSIRAPALPPPPPGPPPNLDTYKLKPR